MPSLTKKQLDAIEKSMVAIIDDPAKAEEIKDTFGEFRKALGEGTPVTADDVDASLEVLLQPIDKRNGASGGGTETLPDDPMAPIFDQLFRQIAPLAKKAGVSSQTLQAMFHKAYGDALGEVDNVISTTMEATAVELGAGDRVQFGKTRHQTDDTAGSTGTGEGEDDMEKVLKKLGVPAAISKRIGTLQAEVAALTHDKAIGLFEKRAAACGEPGLATDLLAIHEIDPELCARVEKLLKGKNEVLRKNTTWSRELGDDSSTQAEGSTGALSQLQGIAREMIAKGLKSANGRPASFQKAFVTACEQNPELYTEYNGLKHREIARGGV
jgi:hypothetical protein